MIIPYVLTCDSVVTRFHKKYIKELESTDEIEAYIQSTGLRKALDFLSLYRRRGIDEDIAEKGIAKSIDEVFSQDCNRQSV
jgi:trans-aconitate methyltransferase